MSQSEGAADVDVAESVETAVAHACTNVPLTEPDRQVGEVRRMLIGRRYDTASHVVVRDGHRFVGILRVEDLLSIYIYFSIATQLIG